MTRALANIGKHILIFDGAIGTLLTKLSGGVKGPLELLNVAAPELVSGVHAQYVDAGADIVTTNTFGANRILLFRHGMGYRVEDFNRGAVIAARKGAAGKALVAGSIGPTGKLMEPFGDVRFEEILDAFLEQAGYLAAEGVDLFTIETMSDLGELRAAIMACREAAPDIPFIANMTFNENGRTLWGTDVLTFASSVEPHNPLAIGINCSLGPKIMLPIIEELCRESSVPVSVMPNAGMPRISAGRTVFPMGPEGMAKYAGKFADAGCSIIGSCCGSTPEHTSLIARAVKGRDVKCISVKTPDGPVCRISSAGQTVRVGWGYPLVPIGERINPTGRKIMSGELSIGKFTRLIKEARGQTHSGARMLDVNVGIPNNDETWLMRHAVKEVQKATALPLSIDSVSVNAIEAGLKAAIGRPLINSVTAEPAKMNVLLPMAKKFGAALIALCLDEKGIPKTPAERLGIAIRILHAAENAGLGPEDILFDPLTLTIGSDAESGTATLETLRLLKSELRVNTILGLSNISHGMPQRPLINAAFLSMAAEAGLDAVIIDPNSQVIMGFLYAVNILTGKEPKATRILKRLTANGQALAIVDETAKRPPAAKGKAGAAKPVSREDGVSLLIKYVMEGDGDSGARLVKRLISSGKDPETLLDEALIPAMERVSEMFSAADFFLPEALMASEAFKECLNEIRKHQKKKARTVKGTVVLATVHGDIHDIGKNLVKMVLENAGYQVHDLGASVPAEEIVETAGQVDADIVALSALMTTTMVEMSKVINLMNARDLDSHILVGGAVLTPQFAEKAGASAYGADAMEGLRKADNIMRSRRRKKDEGV